MAMKLLGGEVPCKQFSCERCTSDLEFLKRKRHAGPAVTGRRVRIVDLFAGCGGMSLGLEEAARRLGIRVEIPLAVDADPDVTVIYEANFPDAAAQTADVTTLFDSELGSAPSARENATRESVGEIDLLVGGPPCQGHSDLNNHTRRRDPKNALYLRMARAAEILVPKLVVVENVVPVERDETGVVEATKEALVRAGYRVDGRIVDLRRVGVPQRRRRYLLIASSSEAIDPKAMLEHLANGLLDHPDRTVRWAIEDLLEVESADAFDSAARRSETNAKRIRYLFEKKLYDLPNSERPECHRDGGHSYVSMYGRLRWDEPAQTITTGFGSMGQGRYVHPARRRTITPHEAARLQSFPDWFDFGAKTKRGVLAKAIGNAVPPLLTVALGLEVLLDLAAAETPTASARRAATG